uniref:uncharacterized protein LOC122593659 isoform X2 n=1 Tax=Erigeron canadensis TaxID=72917 RepID=UPI001CB8C890|nr:uncharacterized protein LOC122593659 isoform X2 [Erigeron canadensis]
MDPNHVVLEISSDEEGGWNDAKNRGITDDDHNWIADILNEVNQNDCGFDDNDNDSDEVVVVSEVLPSKKKKNLSVKSSSLVDFDDDCMVLDHDPDKPLESRNDSTKNRDKESEKVVDENDDDEDDLVVVSEKGQVACRDYPHSRHLCIKFPFSSTPNQSHCDQCYCYVCDSLAPCVYWGDGSTCLDHCQATDKYDFWKLERQNSKDASKILPIQPASKVTEASISIRLPPINLVPPAVHNHVPIPSPAHAYPISSNFGVPNMINQTGTSFLSSRNKYQPSLVSQQLMRTSSCIIPREREHHNYNLGAPLQRPIFKRTGSGGPLTTNRYSYSSYRDDYGNPYSQPSVVSTSLPFSPPNHTFEEPLPRLNPTFDFSPSFQPSLNPISYMESPSLFQPQEQSSLPDYSIPSEASQLVNQGQRSTAETKQAQDIGWSQSQTTHQPPAQSSILKGFVEVPDSLGFNEFSPEPAFIDAENERQHWC